MYHLTLLWLCITAVAAVAGYILGRRHKPSSTVTSGVSDARIRAELALAQASGDHMTIESIEFHRARIAAAINGAVKLRAIRGGRS